MGLSRRWSRLAAVLLAGSLAMTACARSDNGDTEAPGGEGPQDDHFAAGVYQKEAAGEPVRGGTLTFADFVENRTLDPSKGIATGFSGGIAMGSYLRPASSLECGNARVGAALGGVH